MNSAALASQSAWVKPELRVQRRAMRERLSMWASLSALKIVAILLSVSCVVLFV